MTTGREGTGAAQDAGGLTLDSFGGLLSLLLALTAPLYPLGVFVLLLQLSAIYTLDFVTAAFAVSQMPSPVVVGQAVGIVWGQPFILVCAALPVLLAYRQRLAARRPALVVAAIAVAAAVLLLGLAVIPTLASGA